MSGRAQIETAVGKGPSLYPTASVSSKDQAAHTKLKYRSRPQGPSASAPAAAEGGVGVGSKSAAVIDEEKGVDVSAVMLQKPKASAEIARRYDDSDAIQDDGGGRSGSDDDDDDKNKPAAGANSSRASFGGVDDSDDADNNSDEDDNEDSSSDQDSDDDEMALQAELERIKAERAAATAKREQEEREKREEEIKSGALKSNPLVNLSSGGGAPGDGSAKVRRRWNDDVVFRNQARDEPEAKRRFINDTTRSDFHRNFLKRYIR